MIRRKNLPEWLRSFIYDEMGGSYVPDRNAFQNNLSSDEEKNRKYLGTYFPRSFTESYCIFANLFDNTAYVEAMKIKDSVSILSFGCGTGGDLMGLLEAISEKMPWVENVDITAYDGNFNAVVMLKSIVEQPNNKQRFKRLKVDYAPVPMTKPDDFPLFCGVIKKSYDFVVSLKMVNELYRNNIIANKPYAAFLGELASKLTETGVMLLLDVPLKEKGNWLATLMSRGLREFLKSNDGYDAIVPLPCYMLGRKCNERCYLSWTFYGDIFASEPVTYCMLARKELAHSVCKGLSKGDYVINDSNECCKKVRGTKTIDAFNLRKN